MNREQQKRLERLMGVTRKITLSDKNAEYLAEMLEKRQSLPGMSPQQIISALTPKELAFVIENRRKRLSQDEPSGDCGASDEKIIASLSNPRGDLYNALSAPSYPNPEMADKLWRFHKQLLAWEDQQPKKE